MDSVGSHRGGPDLFLFSLSIYEKGLNPKFHESSLCLLIKYLISGPTELNNI